MELSVEDTFKNELYKKYESLKKVLIPKSEYFLLINELKHLNEQSSAKPQKKYLQYLTEINSHSGNLSNYRQTKHEKNNQKIVFFTILDILTEFKIPYLMLIKYIKMMYTMPFY
jgi:hypothetical protein